MQMKAQQITLGTMAGGAVDELFIDAMAKVIENIADPNTDHRFKREITLRFTITPNEERSIGKIVVGCSTKRAAVKGIEVGVYFGTQDGVPIVVEAPRQTDLFPTPSSLIRSATTEPNPSR
jgi:hypothetical protein